MSLTQLSGLCQANSKSPACTRNLRSRHRYNGAQSWLVLAHDLCTLSPTSERSSFRSWSNARSLTTSLCGALLDEDLPARPDLICYMSFDFPFSQSVLLFLNGFKQATQTEILDLQCSANDMICEIAWLASIPLGSGAGPQVAYLWFCIQWSRLSWCQNLLRSSTELGRLD